MTTQVTISADEACKLLNIHRATIYEKARAGQITWHGLRHTWASWHVMNGTPLEVLKELGGWSDMKSVLRYAHLSPGHVAKYANNSKPPS